MQFINGPGQKSFTQGGRGRVLQKGKKKGKLERIARWAEIRGGEH